MYYKGVPQAPTNCNSYPRGLSFKFAPCGGFQTQITGIPKETWNLTGTFWKTTLYPVPCGVSQNRGLSNYVVCFGFPLKHPKRAPRKRPDPCMFFGMYPCRLELARVATRPHAARPSCEGAWRLGRPPRPARFGSVSRFGRLTVDFQKPKTGNMGRVCYLLSPFWLGREGRLCGLMPFRLVLVPGHAKPPRL